MSSSSHQDDDITDVLDKEPAANADDDGQDRRNNETVGKQTGEKEKDEEAEDEVKRKRELYLQKLEE